MNRIVLASLVLALFPACVDTDDLTDAELGELEADATVPVSVTELTNGQSVTISGAAGSSRYFKIVLASNYDLLDLTRSIAAGSEVYVRRDALPTTTTYDCQALSTGGFCRVDYADAGTYYVMVRGTGTSGYSNTTLRSDYRNVYTPVVNNASVAIYNQYGVDLFYKLEVPAGVASVSFKMTLDPTHYGSVDLGVAINHFVQEGYHCWRELGFYKSVLTATCAFVNPPAGTYYVALRGHGTHYEGTLQGWYSWPAPVSTLN